MSEFAAALDAAIEASPRTAKEIARAVGISATHLGRLRNGQEDNPKIQLLIRIARELGTTVGALFGESFAISAADETELLHFRNWIDEKLATIDARAQPNAVIVQQMQAAPAAHTARVADRSRQRIDDPFDANARLVLRAIGDSMIGAGILEGDTLYATPASDDSAIGSIVACRLGDSVFVKRLVSEHSRLYLVSAHARYKPITVDTESFAILGIVIGRVGRIN